MRVRGASLRINSNEPSVLKVCSHDIRDSSFLPPTSCGLSVLATPIPWTRCSIIPSPTSSYVPQMARTFACPNSSSRGYHPSLRICSHFPSPLLVALGLARRMDYLSSLSQRRKMSCRCSSASSSPAIVPLDLLPSPYCLDNSYFAPPYAPPTFQFFISPGPRDSRLIDAFVAARFTRCLLLLAYFLCQSVRNMSTEENLVQPGRTQ